MSQEKQQPYVCIYLNVFVYRDIWLTLKAPITTAADDKF